MISQRSWPTLARRSSVFSRFMAALALHSTPNPLNRARCMSEWTWLLQFPSDHACHRPGTPRYMWPQRDRLKSVSQASGEPRQRNMEGCRGSQGVGSVQLQRAVHPSHHSTLALANRGFKETRASHDMCVECLCRGSWLLYVSDAV